MEDICANVLIAFVMNQVIVWGKNTIEMKRVYKLKLDKY